ncbi:alpha-2-macroglobulin, partial [Candidatus Uhrbacteria bacterium]|nr:alpha-2-macroglobulin [Candidatus Uhrbacteria bacterium]
ETAEILIPSPYPGEQWALVTIERSGILSQEVVLLPTNSSVLSVPLHDEHIPNVYVGVVLVQGGAAAAAAGAPPTAGMNVGYASLTVRPTPKLLNVSIEPAAIDPQPGDAIDVTLLVRDTQGQPVAGRFAVDVVDKAVLSLQPREANRILETFYGERGLGVTTSSSLVVSLSRLVLEQLEDLDIADEGNKLSTSDGFGVGTAVPMAASGMMREAEDASSASPSPAGIAVREEFADTAYWNPLVETDAEGRATLTVELPDNLTTWVVRAVGATSETRVGEGVAEVVVSKPLLVRPVAPRFFVVGDRVRLAASVTNQTAEELSVEVALGSTGVDVEGPVSQTLVIPARSESQATWWVTVLDVPYVDLVWSASAGSFSDAARPRLTTGPNGTIPVYRYTAPETVGTAGELRGAGTRTELIALPASFDAENSRVDV